MVNGGGSRTGDGSKNRAALKKPAGRSPAPPQLRRAEALRRTVTLIRRLGWRRTLLGIFLLAAFAGGFYLANLYSDISQLIAERRAALTSAN
jgi:hypothetical protein